ncbi:hypothetical protein BASA60_005595 [Batrachochytrium salamandrivorans]|nr:hypothetical protein BASA60_005595 [Batrachochytrium salamandrivorans]KAH9268995.1 hypothetical protein BASA83_008997 [Batrachochytrium salamandrivorans]
MDSHGFDTAVDLALPQRKACFRVYETRRSQGPLYVLHHGAGHSALSWVQLAAALLPTGSTITTEPTTTGSTTTDKVTLGPTNECSILCFDARAHGLTTSEEEDIPLNVLADDLAAIVNHLYPPPNRPDIVLVGHSLGGAVVVDVLTRSLIQGVRGVVVLDVVEGTALDSLSHMQRILLARPKSFDSVQDAVKWAVYNNYSKNVKVAQVSIVNQLVQTASGKLVWRTDLHKTSEHWKGWFDNLSEKFLTVRAGRLLVLAGTDRLDKPLMIGQMQGKFQLAIYPESGHNIHEDTPHKLVTDLNEFWKRNQSLATIKRFPIPPLKKSSC